MLHEELASYICIVSCCIVAVVWHCSGHSYTKVYPIQPRQRTSLQPMAGRMVINTQNNSPVSIYKVLQGPGRILSMPECTFLVEGVVLVLPV